MQSYGEFLHNAPRVVLALDNHHQGAGGRGQGAGEKSFPLCLFSMPNAQYPILYLTSVICRV